MSAFIVSDRHINVLVSFAARGGRSGHASYYWKGSHQYFLGNEQHIASALYAENVRSVNTRYRMDQPADGFVFSRDDSIRDPLVIIKACHCLEYQSCETIDWTGTEAFAILKAIQAVAVRSLPGYAESDGWSIPDRAPALAA